MRIVWLGGMPSDNLFPAMIDSLIHRAAETLTVVACSLTIGQQLISLFKKPHFMLFALPFLKNAAGSRIS